MALLNLFLIPFWFFVKVASTIAYDLFRILRGWVRVMRTLGAFGNSLTALSVGGLLAGSLVQNEQKRAGEKLRAKVEQYKGKTRLGEFRHWKREILFGSNSSNISSEYTSMVSDLEMFNIAWEPKLDPRSLNSTESSLILDLSKISFYKYDPKKDIAYWNWDGTFKGGYCTGFKDVDVTLDPDYKKAMKTKKVRTDKELEELAMAISLSFPCKGIPDPTETVWREAEGRVRSSLSEIGAEVFRGLLLDDEIAGLLTTLVT